MTRAVLRLICCVLTLAHLPSLASALPSGRCQADEWRSHSITWWEGNKLHGARIVSRDPNWKIEFGFNESSSIACKKCADGKGILARLWLGLADPEKAILNENVASEVLQGRLSGLSDAIRRYEARPMSRIVRTSVADLNGRARVHQVFDVDVPRRKTFEAIFFAVAKNCISLQGIIGEGNFEHISIDRLRDFASAITVEGFIPPPKPISKVPAHPPRAQFEVNEWRQWLDEQLRLGTINQGKE